MERLWGLALCEGQVSLTKGSSLVGGQGLCRKPPPTLGTGNVCGLRVSVEFPSLWPGLQGPCPHTHTCPPCPLVCGLLRSRPSLELGLSLAGLACLTPTALLPVACRPTPNLLLCHISLLRSL